MPSRTIFIIEDDPVMAECLERSLQQLVHIPHSQVHDSEIHILKFRDAISAVAALSQELPDLILLDVLLDGPNGFTLLNELSTYSDTSQIPVILVTSLAIKDSNLQHYGVTSILAKETMTPDLILNAVQSALGVEYAV